MTNTNTQLNETFDAKAASCEALVQRLSEKLAQYKAGEKSWGKATCLASVESELLGALMNLGCLTDAEIAANKF